MSDVNRISESELLYMKTHARHEYVRRMATEILANRKLIGQLLGKLATSEDSVSKEIADKGLKYE